MWQLGLVILPLLMVETLAATILHSSNSTEVLKTVFLIPYEVMKEPILLNIS